MASRATFSAMPLTFGVNRSAVSVELFRLYSGVVALLSGHSSLFAHRYSCDSGRRWVGVGSHRARVSAGGGILLHSGKGLTRLYRNVPAESVSAYFPQVPWNQA